MSFGNKVLRIDMDTGYNFLPFRQNQIILLLYFVLQNLVEEE